MNIFLENITKSYSDSSFALQGVNLEINSGELVGLIGPSGSGKTTLLKTISGLEYATKGNIYFNAINITNKCVQERNIGFVFQNYALFEHMNVFNNVAFGLKVLPKNVRPSKQFIHNKVLELLALMKIEHYIWRYPHQLSGGERQRVAIARALAINPKILLLDEPFAALDTKVRKELRTWIRKLHNYMDITTIFVTHDQEEALEIADKIVVLNGGKIEQIGTPEEVYKHPINSFVYDFMGDFNVFQGWRDEHEVLHFIETANQETPISIEQNFFQKIINKIFTKEKTNIATNIAQKNILKIFARPHEMQVQDKAEKGFIAARLVHVNKASSLIKMELERKDGSFIYAAISKGDFDKISPVIEQQLFVKPKHSFVFN
jgi:sulfate transport system ATP-binding protein